MCNTMKSNTIYQISHSSSINPSQWKRRPMCLWWPLLSSILPVDCVHGYICCPGKLGDWWTVRCCIVYSLVEMFYWHKESGVRAGYCSYVPNSKLSLPRVDQLAVLHLPRVRLTVVSPHRPIDWHNKDINTSLKNYRYKELSKFHAYLHIAVDFALTRHSSHWDWLGTWCSSSIIL